MAPDVQDAVELAAMKLAKALGVDDPRVVNELEDALRTLLDEATVALADQIKRMRPVVDAVLAAREASLTCSDEQDDLWCAVDEAADTYNAAKEGE